MKNNEQRNVRSLEVTKASGDKALFSTDKLSRSLQRAGADDETIRSILDNIQSRLYDGVTTKKIYNLAFAMLKRSSKQAASKYKLKNAIFELGPSGFPFERFIAEVLKKQGYQVQVGQIKKGHCVNHEVDVSAIKDDKHFMVECKFHHSGGIFCTVKIPLYVQARFRDIEQEWQKQEGYGLKFHQGWVVTNTRFSSDAIQYGICAGLHLLGWDYPAKHALKDQIDTLKLYPITCLHSITRAEKQKLLDKQIVLCKDIRDDNKLLSSIGIDEDRIQEINKEAKTLCDEPIQKMIT